MSWFGSSYSGHGKHSGMVRRKEHTKPEQGVMKLTMRKKCTMLLAEFRVCKKKKRNFGTLKILGALSGSLYPQITADTCPLTHLDPDSGESFSSCSLILTMPLYRKFKRIIFSIMPRGKRNHIASTNMC